MQQGNVAKRNVGGRQKPSSCKNACIGMTAMAKTVDIRVGLVSGIAVQKVIKAQRCSLKCINSVTESLFLFSFFFLFWYIFNNLCQPGANIFRVPVAYHYIIFYHYPLLSTIYPCSTHHHYDADVRYHYNWSFLSFFLCLL